jgi:hypothetical protein
MEGSLQLKHIIHQLKTQCCHLGIPIQTQVKRMVVVLMLLQTVAIFILLFNKDNKTPQVTKATATVLHKLIHKMEVSLVTTKKAMVLEATTLLLSKTR